MPGPETKAARRFIGDAVVKIYTTARGWAMSAPGGRVWELCEALRNLEADAQAAIDADVPWNPQEQRRLKSALVATERFGRLYAQPLFKLCGDTLKLLDARFRIEGAEGFDPTV